MQITQDKGTIYCKDFILSNFNFFKKKYIKILLLDANSPNLFFLHSAKVNKNKFYL